MKKINLVLIPIGVMLSVPSAFAGMHCKAVVDDGRLEFSESSYVGGARPRPGSEMYRATWTYKGQVIAETINYAGPGYPPVEMSLDYDFVEATKVILDDSQWSQKPVGHRTFKEKATLASKDGKTPVLPGSSDSRVDAYMICSESRDTVPRP